MVKLSKMANDFIVDFQDYGLNVADPSSVGEATLKSLGDRIIDVFKTYGFCYLKNHGVDKDLIKDYMQASRLFFEQPAELKEQFPMDSDYRFGWVKLEREKLNEGRSVGDLHEAFNYTPLWDKGWPSVDKFEALSRQFYTSGQELAFRFCDILSLGLGLPIDFMRNAHKLAGQKGNSTQIRTIYYPAVESESVKALDQVRLGEHCDWGTVAFNFQDNVGGLEVKTPKGEFIPADPIPDTVLVTVSTLLQRWTADSLTAAVHRILVPADESRRNTIRQAIVFFLQADDDCTIKCLDGSDKYKPITSKSYWNYKAGMSLDS